MHEHDIEQAIIEMLVAQGYEHHTGASISPHGESPQRESYSTVVLDQQLRDALQRLNPELPESARHEAYQQIVGVGSPDLMASNQRLHHYLTDGVTVEYFADGETHGVTVRVMDGEDMEQNSFWVVDQLIVQEGSVQKRLDLVLYINGLPLVVIELKSALEEDATLQRAYTQIQNYKRAIPDLFVYNALCVISDGIDARTSSVSAPFSRYLAWKTPEPKHMMTEMEMLVQGMLERQTLLTLIRYNTVFETEEIKDEHTGLMSQITIKKVAAYHQYYAVQKAVQATLAATAEDGDRKIGVVWHTQGSGKSLSMVFYAGQIVVHPAMSNPTIVVLTDRNDLDDQLFRTFGNCKDLLRQEPIQARSRDHIKSLLSVASGGVIFTTIQKFGTDDADGVYETLSERSNIVVIADEAHRSQYGFGGRVASDGSLRYGNAKYLRDALPHASFVGFTGTPIAEQDRDTKKVFGDYVDVYDIAQAVDDGATVRISYESRLVKISVDDTALAQVDSEMEALSELTEEEISASSQTVSRINTIVGHPDRLADVAADIVTHFEMRQEVFEGKGMIVCMTRQIAVDLYDQIINLRPAWHSDDLMSGKIKVVMTSSSDDPESFQPHHTTKKQRQDLAARIKDIHDELDLVIVQSMWLTGFDVPALHTMYIDKKMQGANLMQAIARVNRVYKDKPGGLIVDYIGIAQSLREAMSVYTQSGGTGEVVQHIADQIAGMQEKFEIVMQMFAGYDLSGYKDAPTRHKLRIIQGAVDHILSDEDLTKRYLAQVTRLTQLFGWSLPAHEAIAIKEYVALFQAIQSRIRKIKHGSRNSRSHDTEQLMKQIIDESLQSEGVIDIFAAAGLETPTISILSDEFLLEVKNMQHKNIAIELLKKLLSDEVKERRKRNVTQGKKLSDILQHIIKKYHNNQIDSAQMIQELSDIAREMKLEDHKAEELGLTDEEYAFYSVLANNTSTAFLEDAKMRELIHVITDTVRKNATVDREKRDDVRAQLRLEVKKILMRYGYPPDLARIEADRVLEQSELLAHELTQSL